jgi:hypothetical protein
MECVPFFCLFIPLGWFIFFYVLRPKHRAGHLRMYCTRCSHRFYAPDPPPERCPACQTASLERM